MAHARSHPEDIYRDLQFKVYDEGTSDKECNTDFDDFICAKKTNMPPFRIWLTLTDKEKRQFYE